MFCDFEQVIDRLLSFLIPKTEITVLRGKHYFCEDLNEILDVK